MIFAENGPWPSMLSTFPMIASAVVGLAVFLAVWWILRVLESGDLQQGDEWRYDVSRINELRRVSVMYRVFQPAIQLLARFNRGMFRESLPEIQREIQAAGLPRFWLAEEYLARGELIAFFLTPLYVYFLFGLFDTAGLWLSVLGTVLTAWLLRRRLAAQAAERLKVIKRRIPFLLDLLTLLMEAGSTFLNALTQAVEEFEGHPVAVEFGRVLMDMNLGKTRNEAFAALRDRLSDDEITSIRRHHHSGRDAGHAPGTNLPSQADVLRISASSAPDIGQ